MSIVKTEPASSRASPLSTQLRPANVTRSMQRSISHSATSVAALRLWRQDIAFHQGVAAGANGGLLAVFPVVVRRDQIAAAIEQVQRGIGQNTGGPSHFTRTQSRFLPAAKISADGKGLSSIRKLQSVRHR